MAKKKKKILLLLLAVLSPVNHTGLYQGKEEEAEEEAKEEDNVQRLRPRGIYTLRLLPANVRRQRTRRNEHYRPESF